MTQKFFNDLVKETYSIPAFPEDATIAMAYVPFQQTKATFVDLDNSLNAGTIFPILNKPFEGSEAK